MLHELVGSLWNNSISSLMEYGVLTVPGMSKQKLCQLAAVWNNVSVETNDLSHQIPAILYLQIITKNTLNSSSDYTGELTTLVK